MDGDSAAPPFGISWPSEYRDLAGPLRAAWGVEGDIVLVRSLGGLSGARVFIADLVAADFSGQAILKLSSDPDEAVETEASRQENAAAVNPRYGEAHFPSVVASFGRDGQFGTLSTVAGRGLQYVTAWNDCGYTIQLAAGRQVARDLLDEWNAGFELTPTHVAPSALLADWVGYRLDDERGRIADFVRDVCGFAADEPSYIDQGEWFPNPLAFARATVDLPQTTLLRAVVGNLHGDLHGDNVLVSTRPPIRSSYCIIDFADYRDDGFLFYDHAYFELARLLRTHDDDAPRRWKALLGALSRFPHPMADAHLGSDDHGHVEMVRAIRDEVSGWVDRSAPHRLPDLDAQYLLARVGAGLVWTHRRVLDVTRRQAFMYAAANLRDYLDLMEVAWPKWGPPMLRDAAQPAPEVRRPPSEPREAGPAAHAAVDDEPDGAADRVAFDTYRARPMVAVVPFENRSGDKNQEYLADAITDELLIELSKIDWLMPISRHNSFTYKEATTSATTVGAELGVPYVVEGSVRRRDDVVRITAVLEETERGARIWGDRYDIDLGQLHQVEDDIVTMIVANVESGLKGSEQDRARRKPPNDLDAWDLTQRALWHLQRHTPEDDDEAERLAEQAIERDPDYSTPRAVLAVLYSQQFDTYRGPVDHKDLARALEHGRTAVRLNPSEGYAHGALGQALLASGDLKLALAQFEQFVELNPSSSLARLFVAEALIALGRVQEALHAVEFSLTLSPLEAHRGWEYLCRGLCEYALDDYGAAEESFRLSAPHPPTSAFANMGLAATLVRLDRKPEAGRALARAMESSDAGGFAGARDFITPWRGPLAPMLRDGLIEAGLDPELWPATG